MFLGTTLRRRISTPLLRFTRQKYVAHPFLVDHSETAAQRTLRNGELQDKVMQAQEELQSCRACPWECKVDRMNNKEGVCHVGRNAIVSSVFPHFGEESCLQGSYGSGTIFFGLCNMRCVFCQNWDISQKRDGLVLDAEGLSKIMLKLQNQAKCHNINFVTPEHVVPQVVEAIAHATEHGLRIPIVYNTSAYDAHRSLALLDGLVDIYMPDMKFWDETTARRLAKVKNYPDVARKSILEMHRQVGDLVFDSNGIAIRGLIVRHLLMPNQEEQARSILKWIAEDISRDTFVNIMEQYRPNFRVGQPSKGGGVRYEDISAPLEDKAIQEIRDYAEKLGLWRFEHKWDQWDSVPF